MQLRKPISSVSLRGRFSLVGTAMRLRGQGGFGMIEVLISMLLVIMASAGSMALLVSTMNGTRFSGAALVATRLGQTVLDQLASQPFADVSLCNVAGPCLTNLPSVHATGQVASVGSGDAIIYTRSYSVVNLPTVPQRKVIGVRVSWIEGTRTRAINLGFERTQ